MARFTIIIFAFESHHSVIFVNSNNQLSDIVVITHAHSESIVADIERYDAAMFALMWTSWHEMLEKNIQWFSHDE